MATFHTLTDPLHSKKRTKEHLRPLDRQMLSRKSSLASDSGDSDGDDPLSLGGGVWFLVSFTKFSDPSDGTLSVFCEMKNVHKVAYKFFRSQLISTPTC